MRSLVVSAFLLVPRMSQASNLDTTQRTFDGANRFGLQLLSQLVQEQPRERNFVVSPASIQLALSMAYAGAEGATADAMANALGWGGTSREQLLELQSALQASLKSPGSDIVQRIANALWVDEPAILQPAYSQAVEQQFGSEIFSRPFPRFGNHRRNQSLGRPSDFGKDNSNFNGASAATVMPGRRRVL
jgi:serine protease inhibitor